MIFKCSCGNEFSAPPSRLGRKKYCSKACFYKYRTRPSGLTYTIVADNKGWFKRKDIVVPDNKGYIRRRFNGKMKREHIIVLEKKLGRKLKDNEVTHHLNGVKTDNRSENLVVMLKKEHDKLHNGKKYIQTT